MSTIIDFDTARPRPANQSPLVGDPLLVDVLVALRAALGEIAGLTPFPIDDAPPHAEPSAF